MQIESVEYKDIPKLAREKMNLLVIHAGDFYAGFVVGALSTYCKVYVAHVGRIYYAVADSNICLLDFFAEEFGYIPPNGVNSGGFVKVEIGPNSLNVQFSI